MQHLVFINSHPIQYNAPLYEKISCDNEINLLVLYCSDESIQGAKDKEFNVGVKWDIPLLKGYSYKFLKNYSWKPSIHNGFLGLINLSIITELHKIPRSIIVIHGWAYFTTVLAIILGKMYGHTVYLRGESPYNQEILKGKKNQLFKKIFLKNFLFHFVDKFLYIGEQNKRFYLSMGVDESQLIFTPYAVDNERFQNSYKILQKEKNSLKEKFNIPLHHKVILYVGKYIAKKRPIDLLSAFKNLKQKDVSLIMVGEGKLRTEMEYLIQNENIANVYLTGFVNQAEIIQYYAIADAFVMCSDIGETWGLSVNEAMNFSLPIIVSDMTGCSIDLVKNGINGFVFETGNIAQLTDYLAKILSLSEEELAMMGSKSFNLISNYGYENIITNIKQRTWQDKIITS
ncbi:glycosyltransferase family 4 protein [Rhodocytophaga rosea]|uniref:Glycosyltransferase family 4 protein n=1 Tax=Rhodocytophaga rosea TaxID=2704465 RepID=A0A6C0GCT1_9BACT|nr:glycosyltransferase family 4 protein [Rhodocytophaga rosea]QHT65765.1 glycosyltransferase family 4 protein [Rhodocytophaga rosea]